MHGIYQRLKIMAKCNRIGCINKSISKGFCKQHTSSSTSSEKYKRVIREHHKLYNTTQWRRMRYNILSKNPLCARCSKYNYIEPAVDVDHIISHKGNKELFYDMNNLQPLCKKCHSWKTNRENTTLAATSLDFRNDYS